MTCRDARGRFALIGAFMIVPLVSACVGGPAPTRLDPTEGQMIGHYGRFGEIQSSLIMGDLEAARGAAQSLAQRPFPPTTTVWVDALKAAANEIATASDLDAATQASGTLVQSCGSCHAELGAKPNVRFVAGAPSGDSRADHMSRGLWAVDQLMDGMVSGDNEYWMNGARVLADDENLSALGNQVMAAMGDQRAVVYGWVLKGCADCHTR